MPREKEAHNTKLKETNHCGGVPFVFGLIFACTMYEVEYCEEQKPRKQKKQKKAMKDAPAWALGAAASQGANRWRFRVPVSSVRGLGGSRYRFGPDH